MNPDFKPLPNLLVLHSVPETQETALAFPADNFVGALLLAELLNAKLEAAGQLLQPGSGNGVLNHFLFIAAVRDPHVAARIVNGAAPMVLAIFRLDEARGVFSRMFAADGNELPVEKVVELSAAINRLQAPALARLNDFTARVQAQAALSRSPATENPS